MFSIFAKSFIVLWQRLLCCIAHLDIIKEKFHILKGEVQLCKSYSFMVTSV